QRHSALPSQQNTSRTCNREDRGAAWWRQEVVVNSNISVLGVYHERTGLSVCPSDRPGATQSRTRCFSSLASGKRPCAARDQMVSPSTRTSKTPPLPGCNATSPRSAAKVVNNSWAIHAARNSHQHCVQYSISTRGCFGIFLTLYVGVLLRVSGFTPPFVKGG